MSEATARSTSAALPTVWIVDDSPLEAELVRRTLASVYRVEVFNDGAAVIEQFASEPPPDAVVLDWRMPGISGLDVCKFLRGRPQTQSIPILMLSVQGETGDLVKCLAAGADDFLSKPCSGVELSARVAALVRSKKMHERAQSAERAVRSLLMGLPEGVMSVDAAERVTFVNLEAQRMLAADANTLVGKLLREVLPGFSFKQAAAFSAEPIALPDLVLRGRVFAPAIRLHSGVDMSETTLSFRDVTSEREEGKRRADLLDAERAARTQAEDASRAKDDFLAIVSHELRTPLNAILGWAKLVSSGTLDEGRRAGAMETIERNATAQQKLIEDILDVSRIIAGKMALESSPVDLQQAVRASMDAMRPAAEAKGIELTRDAWEGRPIVVGDPSRLQQIVSNLLSNAVKFTPRGGSVSVALTIENDSARIRVRDSGKGIAADLLPRIFDRFRQGDTGTSRSHGGLGLGLSIVRHLVELHGGSVEAESPGRDKGATLTVRLPLASLDADASGSAFAVGVPVARVRTDGGLLTGVRVLVVDDEEDARALLVAVFQERAAIPLAVSSVAEAMDAVATFRPTVVVADIGMPGEDGYSLVARLRRLPHHEGGATPVVAVTAFAAPRDEDRAIAAGFNAHMAKPVDPGHLVDVVGRLAGEASGRL